MCAGDPGCLHAFGISARRRPPAIVPMSCARPIHFRPPRLPLRRRSEDRPALSIQSPNWLSATDFRRASRCTAAKSRPSANGSSNSGPRGDAQKSAGLQGAKRPRSASILAKDRGWFNRSSAALPMRTPLRATALFPPLHERSLSPFSNSNFRLSSHSQIAGDRSFRLRVSRGIFAPLSR
jgi:hypothetical protein